MVYRLDWMCAPSPSRRWLHFAPISIAAQSTSFIYTTCNDVRFIIQFTLSLLPRLCAYGSVPDGKKEVEVQSNWFGGGVNIDGYSWSHKSTLTSAAVVRLCWCWTDCILCLLDPKTRHGGDSFLTCYFGVGFRDWVNVIGVEYWAKSVVFLQ